jgi:cytoskeleton protein RodZ
MLSFGERLKAEREIRGRSLDDLGAETKVNLRHLEALERSEFHQLPGGIIRRGIVRGYLRALNLTESDWMQEFQNSLEAQARARGERIEPEEDDWVTFASNVKKNRIGQRRNTYLRWLGVLMFVALLALAGWALWVFELKALIYPAHTITR